MKNKINNCDTDKNIKAVFNTKIVSPSEDYTKHNGEIVKILSSKIYNNRFSDTRYKIEFYDGTVVENIMDCELIFALEDIEIAEIKTEIKKINKQLAYIRRRDRVCCSFGSDYEYEELIEKRNILRNKLRKVIKSYE